MKNIIKDLISLCPRQGKNLAKTKRYLIAYLKKSGVKVKEEDFAITVPLITKTSLTVDNKAIHCLGCSFIGGNIINKDTILSSTIPSRYNLDLPNINFNPYSAGICRNNFYFAPALAVARSDVAKIVKARSVNGKVVVKKYEGRAAHLLVGNTRNPHTIVFAHYDSIGQGATDNASGVAVMLQIITEFPKTLADTLYVFDGNEELSYDYPTYWGHGFRVFEKRHNSLLAEAKQIIIVDCVGNGPTKISSNPQLLELAFPIKNSAKWLNKTSTLYGDIGKLMAVYHSEADSLDQLTEKYLHEAANILQQLIINEG